MLLNTQKTFVLPIPSLSLSTILTCYKFGWLLLGTVIFMLLWEIAIKLWIWTQTILKRSLGKFIFILCSLCVLINFSCHKKRLSWMGNALRKRMLVLLCHVIICSFNAFFGYLNVKLVLEKKRRERERERNK